MDNPKVSVIMGIYNGEKTMKRAIDSIIEQTFPDWELIICDDCSTDNTYKIATEYAEKDSRIKVIQNEKNMRLAYSLNHCLSVANGEYIARMDDDDICLPDRFEKQVAYLDAHPEMSVVGSAAIVFDDNGDRFIRGLGKEYPLKNTVNTSTPFIHPTIMMRKSAYDILNGYVVSPDTMRAEDLDLWYRFRLAGLDGYTIQEPLLKYCERASDYKKRTLKAAIGIARIHRKYLRILKLSHKWDYIIYRPIIGAILPRWVMEIYHKNK